MASKAHDGIKGPLLLTVLKNTLFNGQTKVKCSLEPGSCSFTGVDLGAGLLTGSVISVCPAPLDLFTWTLLKEVGSSSLGLF